MGPTWEVVFSISQNNFPHVINNASPRLWYKKMALRGKDAREFVRDIRDGLHDEALQQKYNIYGKKFRIAKAQVIDFLAKAKASGTKPAREIDGRQFLADVRSGLDDDILMGKYNVSARQLQALFRELIAAGAFTPLELSNRLAITKSQVAEAFQEMGRAVQEIDEA